MQAIHIEHSRLLERELEETPNRPLACDASGLGAVNLVGYLNDFSRHRFDRSCWRCWCDFDLQNIPAWVLTLNGTDSPAALVRER
jgi:hypothetical protein